MRDLRVSATFSKYFFGVMYLFAPIFLMITLFLSDPPAILKKILTDSYTMSSKVEIVQKVDQDQNVTYLQKYHYFIDGTEHICLSGSRFKPSDKNEKIYYNSKNPDICVSESDVDGFYYIADSFAIFIIFIVIVMSFGLFLIINTFVKNAKIKQLTKTGKLIKYIPCKIYPKDTPIISRLCLEYGPNWMGHHGYVVELEYSGLNFKSEIKHGIDIRRNTADLLIDPMNPKNYFIDFDIN